MKPIRTSINVYHHSYTVNKSFCLTAYFINGLKALFLEYTEEEEGGQFVGVQTTVALWEAQQP